jgi:pimeloyl-ACP methyl ester carboxylesterase
VARIQVNGLEIGYEIIGDGKKNAIITPGGRFSKDTPGVRQLAEELAKDGYKTVIWDRVNCGESEISFAATTESRLNADTLAGLLKVLNMTPALVIGGSAGARVSLLAAAFHPDVVERLAILWITGGTLSLAMLAYHYCHDSMFIAERDGMEAVTKLPAWKEPVERNPKNKQILLSQDKDAFVQKMKDWGAAFMAPPGEAVPGLNAEALARVGQKPVMVFRSGKSDVHHPRDTSEAVAKAIPGAKLVEPPWGDREWLDRSHAAEKGEGIFARWPLLAPQILAFAKT